MRVSVSVVLSRGSVVVSEAQWISLGLSGGPWGSLGTVRLSWLSAQCIYTPFMTKSSLSTWSWLRAQTVRGLFLYDFGALHEVHILHIFKEISWMWWSLPYVWSNIEFMFRNNYVSLIFRGNLLASSSFLSSFYVTDILKKVIKQDCW